MERMSPLFPEESYKKISFDFFFSPMKHHNCKTTDRKGEWRVEVSTLDAHVYTVFAPWIYRSTLKQNDLEIVEFH